MKCADESPRNGSHQTHQSAQCVLEPRPGARNGIRLLDVFPNFLLADQFHESADEGVRGLRDFFSSNRILAQYGFQQIVTARALGEFCERTENRILDELDDSIEETLRERDQPIDRVHEQSLGPIPDAPQAEDISPAKGVDEGVQRRFELTANGGKCGKLLLDPRTHFLEDTVVFEGFSDQMSPGQKLDDGAQNVGRAPVGLLHVNRIETNDDGEHTEARYVVGFVRKVIEHLADNAALHHRRGLLGHGDILFALHGTALLDGVCQLVRDQFFALIALGLKFIFAEENVVAHGKGLGVHLPIQFGGFVSRVDFNVAEISTEARLHEPAHGEWQRRTGRRAVLDVRRHVRGNIGLGFGLLCENTGRSETRDVGGFKVALEFLVFLFQLHLPEHAIAIGPDVRNGAFRDGHPHDLFRRCDRLFFRGIGRRRNFEGSLYLDRRARLHGLALDEPRHGGRLHSRSPGYGFMRDSFHGLPFRPTQTFLLSGILCVRRFQCPPGK